MTWVRLTTAIRFSVRGFGVWSVLRRGLSREHGGEWPRIEDGANLGNLLALDLIPFANKRGPGRRLGHEIVKQTHIVAIDEHLPHIHALDHLVQLLERLQIRLRLVEAIDRAAKREIVMQEFSCCAKISLPHRSHEPLHDLTCICHFLSSRQRFKMSHIRAANAGTIATTANQRQYREFEFFDGSFK